MLQEAGRVDDEVAEVGLLAGGSEVTVIRSVIRDVVPAPTGLAAAVSAIRALTASKSSHSTKARVYIACGVWPFRLVNKC